MSLSRLQPVAAVPTFVGHAFLPLGAQPSIQVFVVTTLEAFVPVSLASATARVNVREIDGTDRTTWTFAVFAVAELTISVLSWLL